tara:strand:+ start:67 stop:336 length:270 start_codon:yes stop_codon:yes gene_type:complete
MKETQLSNGDWIKLYEEGWSEVRISSLLKEAVRDFAIHNDMTLGEGLARILVSGLAGLGPETYDRHILAAEARMNAADTPTYPISEVPQ